MGSTEAARHELYTRLVAALGEDATETLMTSLPPTGWADVATVHTQQQLADQLRAELSECRGEIRGELHELRGELRATGAELRQELTTLRADVHGEVAALRVELHDSLRRQTFLMVAAMVGLSTVVGAAASLG